MIVTLPDPDRPFSFICVVLDGVIGSARFQADTEVRDAFKYQQLETAEKNYPSHDKELFAMKHDLVKFRVHLIGCKPFVISTDDASLRTATSRSARGRSLPDVM